MASCESKKICFVPHGYPTIKAPTYCCFVDQLACAMADLGHIIHVVNPIQSKNAEARGYIGPYWQRRTSNNNLIHVHQPLNCAKTRRLFGPFYVGKNSEESFYYYAKKVLRKIERPDYLYAHFLRPADVAAARLGREQKIPSFCAFGESSLWSIEGCSDYEVSNKLRALTGVIAVSTENKRILLEHGLVPEEKIAVFPNGVDLSLFAPLDKKECRRKLGFPDDICIGIFVGSFIEP